MADNPRQPEHHSDIPSSRPSGGTPNPSASSPGGNYSPPPQHSSSSHGRLIPKNIIIGAIVTIITSTTVFLITQSLKKPEGDSFLSVKQATTSAWNSYVGYENVYANNILSFTKNPGTASIDSVLSVFKTESGKFQRDVSDLATDKKIDKDLKKVLTRRLENEKASIPVLENYYANLNKINNSNTSLREKVKATADEMERYTQYTKGFYERAINDVQGLADVLSKRYDQKFSVNDFVMVQMQPQFVKTNDSLINVLRNIRFDSSGQIIDETEPVIDLRSNDIVGNWNADGDVFTFEKNGRMAWVLGGGQKAVGTWKIEDNKLRLDGEIVNIKQKGFWLFTVTEITENSLTLTSVKESQYFYHLVRIISQ